MTRPRVLLADDHTLLLEAFAKLLEPECDVVGTASDGRALVEAARKLEPDVIVADVSMPHLNGLEAGRQLKELLPEVKLVFLTVNEDADLAAEALRMEASAYLLKKSAVSELFQAIQEVLRGRSYVTPLLAPDGIDAILKREPRQASEKLTPRQREVLQLLAEGNSMKQTANALNVTPRTVAFHKYRMMEQLGFETTAELIQFAIREGIVSA
jgi:DNA-binding NarL/FixJ family response regulator